MVAPTDPGTTTGGHWACRTVGADGQWLALTGVRSPRHPDKTLVELTADEAAGQIGDDATCVCTYDAERTVTQVLVTTLSAPKAPPLWFVELRESAGQPPAVHLVAFTGHGVRAGSLLDGARFDEVDAVSEDQVGAVRWYPATGEIDQIYVQPGWRRRNVALALITAVATLVRARDWARVWGDGQRTELGDQWVSSQPWRERAAPLTHTAPPMTPGEAGSGEQRHIATDE